MWIDGPLTRAVRSGAICYLDEVVEARKDTTVVIHSLTDHRRMLPIEKTGEMLDAHAGLPAGDLLQPRLPERAEGPEALDPPALREPGVRLSRGGTEATIIAHESGVDAALAERLAMIGEKVRNLREHGFEEGVSTRLLVYAAQLAAAGIAPRRACDTAIVHAVTDDRDVQQAVGHIVDVLLP